jgi:hypothetical protein
MHFFTVSIVKQYVARPKDNMDKNIHPMPERFRNNFPASKDNRKYIETRNNIPEKQKEWLRSG